LSGQQSALDDLLLQVPECTPVALQQFTHTLFDRVNDVKAKKEAVRQLLHAIVGVSWMRARVCVMYV
jgi:hypothetical protein